MSDDIAHLIATINDSPDPSHGDLTPSVHALVQLGVPALPSVLPLLMSDDKWTRLRAQRVLERTTRAWVRERMPLAVRDSERPTTSGWSCGRTTAGTTGRRRRRHAPPRSRCGRNGWGGWLADDAGASSTRDGPFPSALASPPTQPGTSACRCCVSSAACRTRAAPCRTAAPLPRRCRRLRERAREIDALELIEHPRLRLHQARSKQSPASWRRFGRPRIAREPLLRHRRRPDPT